MKKTRILLVVSVLIALLTAAGVANAASVQRNFRAHLSGADAGADTQGEGEAIFQFSKDGSELHYKLIASNIENITQAHIHMAPAGSNGPIVLWLYPAAPPSQLIPGRHDGVLAEGTVTADDLVGLLAGHPLDDLYAAIAAGNTYVNVHTSQFPGGEIRGQIH